MPDFITIGSHIINKDKINYVGIDSENIDDVINNISNKFISIIISGGKTIKVPYKSKEEANKELKRIQEELTNPAIKSIRDLVLAANEN